MWDFHRFRVAPEVAQVLAAVFVAGKAELLIGSVAELRAGTGGKVVARLEQMNKQPLEWSFDYVINCTGPNPC